MKSLKTIFISSFFAVFISSYAGTYIPGGYVSGTWTAAGSPYIIQGEIKIDGGTSLTIEAGVTVEFSGHYKFLIYGRLVANGTSGNHIVFTAQVPATGWHSLRFIEMNVNPMDTSYLTYCDLYYGIASGTSPNDYGGGIYCYNSSKIKLDHCQISDCIATWGGGMYCDASSPVILSTVFYSNDDVGLYINSNSSPYIDDCTFSENDVYGLYLYNSPGAPIITGCLFKDNTGYPVYCYPDYVGGFSDNSYSGNTNSYFAVGYGVISRDAIWEDPEIPYCILGDLFVRGTNGGNSITTLNILPGATLLFSAQTGISVGSNTPGIPGGLVANGLPGDSIIFTGLSSTPGYWDGIAFYDYAMDSLCAISYCAIRYGGYGSNDNLMLYSCSFPISNTISKYANGNGINLTSSSSCQIYKCNFSNNSLDGLYISSSDPVVRRCKIQSNNAYGINCAAISSPQVDSCLIIGNSSHGLYSPNSASSPIITNDTFSNNLNYPVRIYCDAVGGMVNNVFIGNAYQRIYVDGGTISHDGTWWNQGVSYYIVSSISVSGNHGPDNVTSLTLRPGDSLIFSSNAGITIGNPSSGALWAEGSPSDTIVFTGLSKVLGYWNGIYFAPNTDDALSKLHYCKVEYGGYSSYELVQCVSSSPWIAYCNVQYGSGSGILLDNSTSLIQQTKTHHNTMHGVQSITGGNPQITGCDIYNNSSDGILTSTNIQINGCSIHGCINGIESNSASTLTLIGCSINSNNLPVLIFASQVGGLSGNTYTGNTSQQISVKGNSITTDAVWVNPCIPYVILSDLTIEGNHGTNGVTTLTILPGCILKFSSQTGIYVAPIGNLGGLIAHGNLTDTISFTAYSASPAPGYWDGIIFSQTSVDSLCQLSYCKLEYGGYSSFEIILCVNSAPTIEHTMIKDNSGSISCTSYPAPTFSHCTIKNNSVYGFYLDGSSPTLSNCRISNNSSYGIYLINDSNPLIDSCQVVQQTSSYGIYVNGDSPDPIISHCKIDSNNYPLRLKPDKIRYLHSNSFVGNSNQLIYVDGGTVSHDGSWENPGIPLRFTGGFIVQGNDGANGITSIDIADGTQLRFDNATGITIGHATNPSLSGGIKAIGDCNNPILFTANTSSPSPGYWTGINFLNTSVDSLCYLRFCIVEYAGYSSNNALSLNSAAPLIENSKIHLNTAAGIYCSNGSAPVIRNNIIRENTTQGINCSSSNPSLYNNTIANQTSGLYCSGTANPQVFNNIFFKNTTGINSTPLISTVSYNDFSGNTANYTGTIPSGFGDLTFTNYNGTPCDALYNIFEEPKFVDHTSYDYNLALESPCKNAGKPVTDTAGNDFCAEGNPRFLEEFIDIGACEGGMYWTGAVSSDWHNANNWSNDETPKSTVSITITNDYLNPPVISAGDAVCRRLFLKNGAIVSIATGLILDIVGP